MIARSGGFTLVLGGGGAVGVAYIAGVLRAIDEIAGIDLRTEPDVIVGTSAGSVVAGHLRLGLRPADISALPPPGLEPGREGPPRRVLIPAWTSRTEFARRMVGSTWVVARNVTRLPLARPPRAVQRMFPGALFHISDEDWDAQGFPDEWPDRPLWLVTVDLDSGQRIVIRRPEEPGETGTLRQGLAASCAVPGLWPPVRIGSHRLVDGGVASVTNLDLAVKAGARAVIGVSPMGFDPRQPPSGARRATRARFNSQLARESARVRRSGAELLLVRPTGAELTGHGSNMLKRSGNDAVALAAYDATARRLDDPDARRTLEMIRSIRDTEEVVGA